MHKNKYVHGYTERENARLCDQANALSELLHHDSFYPAGGVVLEAGCGIGAQTIILAKKSPKARFISVDVSRESLARAELTIKRAKINNVKFQQADIFHLPFAKKSFDHVFVCFVLEHLERPLRALQSLKAVLKKGGSITVIEGDHGSAYFHPESKEADRNIQCLIELQAGLGGNSLIGRQLYPVMKQAGFREIRVSPRMVYVDSSRPELVEGFTKNTFIAMVENVREQALQSKMIDMKSWSKGIKDLYKTAGPGGTFCYTFFKATAIK